MMFATVPQCKEMLRIDDGDLVSDEGIEQLILTASEMVRAYLKADSYQRPLVPEVLDEDGVAVTETVFDFTVSPPVLNARITQATIMLVGYLYRSPDQNLNNEWQHGMMPLPVSNLLYQMRQPALA